MEQLKVTSINNQYHHNNNQQDQHPSFEATMDMMDFSMFPPDYSVLNSTQLTGDNDHLLRNESMATGECFSTVNNNAAEANHGGLNTFLTSNDLYKCNSQESSMFNSDDLMFSQQGAYAQMNKSNQLNGLFNNDIYFVNGLLTPPNSDNTEVNQSVSNLNTVNNINNYNNSADINHQVLSFNKEFEDVDYFGSSFDHLPSFNLKNPQLSSPLHSPNYHTTFEEFQPYFTTASANKKLPDHSKLYVKEKPKHFEHNAKKNRNTSVPAPTVSTGGVTKPPANKRSKTLNDLKIPTKLASVSPSPIDFNPAVPNQFQWINVSPITDARYKEVLDLAGQRKLDKKKVIKILDSFRQNDVSEKLNLINRKLGSKISSSSSTKLAKMNIREVNGSFQIICNTSSGYDTPVEEHESIPSGLLKLNILKDHVNYKLYDELASSLKVMAEQNSKNDKIKRPLNQFMLYKRSMIKAANIFKVVEMVKENNHDELLKMDEELKRNPKSSLLNEIVDVQPKLDHHNTCHVIALLWVTESEAVKEQFAKFAKLEKDIHGQVFPNYKFNPQKRNSTTK